MKVRGSKSGFRRTIPIRRKLRRNLTPAEQMFWAKVSNKQFLDLKFRKQHGVGNYIVDFYCPQKKLIIEIDGDSHAENVIIDLDSERQRYIESLGYKIIRYSNRDIMTNIEGVFVDLTDKLDSL